MALMKEKAKATSLLSQQEPSEQNAKAWKQAHAIRSKVHKPKGALSPLSRQAVIRERKRVSRKLEQSPESSSTTETSLRNLLESQKAWKGTISTNKQAAQRRESDGRGRAGKRKRNTRNAIASHPEPEAELESNLRRNSRFSNAHDTSTSPYKRTRISNEPPTGLPVEFDGAKKLPLSPSKSSKSQDTSSALSHRVSDAPTSIRHFSKPNVHSTSARSDTGEINDVEDTESEWPIRIMSSTSGTSSTFSFAVPAASHSSDLFP